MTLQERWTGWFGGSLAKRTLLAVAGFGLGTVAIILLLSLVVTSVADSVLPSSGKDDELEPGSTVDPVVTAAPRSSRPSAPLTPGRRRLPPRTGASGSLGLAEPAPGPAGPTEPTLAPSRPDATEPALRDRASLTNRSRANEAQRPSHELPL